MALRNYTLQILALTLGLIANISFGAKPSVTLNSFITAAKCLEDPTAKDCPKLVNLLITYKTEKLAALEQALSENASPYATSFRTSFCAFYSSKKTDRHPYCPEPVIEIPHAAPIEIEAPKPIENKIVVMEVVEIHPTFIIGNKASVEPALQIQTQIAQTNYLAHLGIVGVSAVTAGCIVAAATYAAPTLFFASWIGGITLGVGVGGSIGGTIGYFVEDIGFRLGVLEGMLGGLIGGSVAHAVATHQITAAQQQALAIENAIQRGNSLVHRHLDIVRGNLDGLNTEVARLGNQLDALGGGLAGGGAAGTPPPSFRGDSMRAPLPMHSHLASESRRRACSVVSSSSGSEHCYVPPVFGAGAWAAGCEIDASSDSDSEEEIGAAVVNLAPPPPSAEEVAAAVVELEAFEVPAAAVAEDSSDDDDARSVDSQTTIPAGAPSTARLSEPSSDRT